MHNSARLPQRSYRPHSSCLPQFNTLVRTMSSDYGSDILSDDIHGIDNAQRDAVAESVPSITPRKPMIACDANVLATPPRSEVRRRNEKPKNASEVHATTIVYTEHGGSHRNMSGIASITPRTPAQRHPAPHQNAPSSSQPLPTPLTARATPSSGYIPPSSQPTPTKVSTDSQLQRTPPTTRPLQPTYRNLPSMQATPGSCIDGQPLYRFPFGTHRGKTLLDVPENYIAYLRVDQNMAHSMPGLAAVLRLYDAGQPPVAPLPPLSISPLLPSQPICIVMPSSSASAKVSESHPAQTSAIPPTPAPAQVYRFDFGIHAGKTLVEVPPEYLKFLKQRGIVEGKPALAVAVIKHERELLQNPPPSSQPDPARYTLKFGKHKGRTLSEIPNDYITWLKNSTTMCAENQALHDAILCHERANPVARSYSIPRPHSALQSDSHLSRSTPSLKRKRPRAPPRAITYGSLTTSSSGRRYAHVPKRSRK
jgi:uncharacterized protein (DUF3820 family)